MIGGGEDRSVQFDAPGVDTMPRKTLVDQHGCPRVKLQVDEARGDVAGFCRKLGYEVQPLVSMAKWFRVSDS